MIIDINHFGIVVPDLEAATEFYTKIMGLKLIEIRERDGLGISQVLGYTDTRIRVADIAPVLGKQLN